MPEVEPSLLPPANDYVLSTDAPVDLKLQPWLEALDERLRARHGIAANETALGVLDLRDCRLAMVQPDRLEYAASVAKIGILLAYFHLHPGAATDLPPATRHKLALMIKSSSNEAASEFSQTLGLRRIQDVLRAYELYDIHRGGGIWVGKHYGITGERIGDPLGDNSHAATIRQLLRFYLLLEQGKLVSPAVSRTMREIFAAPELPHDPIKFVKGLFGRKLEIIRKWGSWEDWLHDTAVIEGPGRHYVLAALTHHPRGDFYLEELAPAVDDFLLANH